MDKTNACLKTGLILLPCSDKKANKTIFQLLKKNEHKSLFFTKSYYMLQDYLKLNLQYYCFYHTNVEVKEVCRHTCIKIVPTSTALKFV